MNRTETKSKRGEPNSKHINNIQILEKCIYMLSTSNERTNERKSDRPTDPPTMSATTTAAISSYNNNNNNECSRYPAKKSLLLNFFPGISIAPILRIVLRRFVHLRQKISHHSLPDRKNSSRLFIVIKIGNILGSEDLKRLLGAKSEKYGRSQELIQNTIHLNFSQTNFSPVEPTYGIPSL